MIELQRILQVVVDALERAGARYLIVGSTAAAAWGVVRTTRDIDIVVVLDANQTGVVLGSLQNTDLYVPIDEARAAARNGGSFNVLDVDHGGKIDLFLSRPDDAFTESRMERRIRADVFDVPCWVATAEDVVLAKLRWRLDSRSEVQWRDCVEIASVNDLDRAYLRRWAAELGITEDVEQLIAATEAAGA